MSCAGCSVSNGKVNGCRSNGGCGSGGCNRMNTYDWLTYAEIPSSQPFEWAEVSFKNGARKMFYQNPRTTQATTGDMVVVETNGGYDVGKISLSGELVRLQMRKKRVRYENISQVVIRRANHRDVQKLEEARSMEQKTMVRARAIARTLDLDMKIGDVEYQGDKRKATFYYTADGRVDFRELIRHYAKEFRVKIEMRQIGARQESARIGGVGSCGRELCCSTWLTDFKSVTTSAARYQNLAINQTKLSGQCGRLKCCLNYELDTYMDAIRHFPTDADKLYLEGGYAMLVKTDIFKKLMYYVVVTEYGRGKTTAVPISRAVEIRAMNKNGEKPSSLIDINVFGDGNGEEDHYAAVNEVIDDLPVEKRKKRGGSRGRGGNRRNRDRSQGRKNGRSGNRQNARSEDQKNEKSENRRNRKQADGKTERQKDGKTGRDGNQKNSKQENSKKGRPADRKTERSKDQKTGKPENRKSSKHRNSKTGRGEDGKTGKSENSKNEKPQNSKTGKSKNWKFRRKKK